MILQTDFSFFTPTNTSAAVYTLLIFLLVLALLYLLFRYTNKNKIFIREMWLKLMRHGYRQKLTEKEILGLKRFYNNLSLEQISEIFLQRDFFRKKLFEFFGENNETPSQTEVSIFDKLFPELTSGFEIRSVDNLHVGEGCGIEVDNFQFFGQVIKYANNQILLSANLLGQESTLPSKEAKLYFYRQDISGFYLFGKIIKANNKGLIFHFNGKILKVNEHHLMAELSFDFKLTLTEFQDLNVELLKPASGADEFKRDPVVIAGVSVRVSDRAMLCKLTNLPSMKYSDGSFIFFMQMELPDGFTVVSHCKLQKSNYPDLFLVRFLDIQNLHKDLLIAEIRRNNPTREQLS